MELTLGIINGDSTSINYVTLYTYTQEMDGPRTFLCLPLHCENTEKTKKASSLK